MSGADRVLLADVGGTNARFALLSRGSMGPVENLKVADHAGVIEAAKAFLGRAPKQPVRAALLGVAGTVENGRCRVTNSGWTIDGPGLRTAFGLTSVHVLNDFEALAWSLPRLSGADLFPIGEGRAIADAPMAVIGPGTGFGAACLVGRDGSPFAVAGEAGHATLPGASLREDAVIDRLRRRFGHVSIERALSGPGLENLYDTIAALDHADVPRRDATAITRLGMNGSCAVSRAALDMFCAMFGTVAGNLALTFRARGGVFIAGGIIPRFPEHLARSEFRARFEAKGRYRSYLQCIPTSIIMRPDACFVGLQAYFESAGAALGTSDWGSA